MALTTGDMSEVLAVLLIHDAGKQLVEFTPYHISAHAYDLVSYMKRHSV